MHIIKPYSLNAEVTHWGIGCANRCEAQKFCQLRSKRQEFARALACLLLGSRQRCHLRALPDCAKLLKMSKLSPVSLRELGYGKLLQLISGKVVCDSPLPAIKKRPYCVLSP